VDILDQIVEDADSPELVHRIVVQECQRLLHGCDDLPLRIQAFVKDLICCAVNGGHILSEYLPIRFILRIFRQHFFQKQLVIDISDVLTGGQGDVFPL
jgi:hypothetical protein